VGAIISGYGNAHWTPGTAWLHSYHHAACHLLHHVGVLGYELCAYSTASLILSEEIMLDALLETIGALGILVSLAAKFGKPSLDAMAADVDGRDCQYPVISAIPSMRKNRAPADPGHRKRHDDLIW
jgi:hypothetical protein